MQSQIYLNFAEAMPIDGRAQVATLQPHITTAYKFPDFPPFPHFPHFPPFPKDSPFPAFPTASAVSHSGNCIKSKKDLDEVKRLGESQS
jgi:hypothetical protein